MRKCPCCKNWLSPRMILFPGKNGSIHCVKCKNLISGPSKTSRYLGFIGIAFGLMFSRFLESIFGEITLFEEALGVMSIIIIVAVLGYLFYPLSCEKVIDE